MGHINIQNAQQATIFISCGPTTIRLARLFLPVLPFEETYDSNEDARYRFANLHLPSPDTPEDNEYAYVMRNGFRVRTVVYVLQTDAIIFWDEVQRFAKELANAVQGVDLTRAIINNPAEQIGYEPERRKRLSHQA